MRQTLHRLTRHLRRSFRVLRHRPPSARRHPWHSVSSTREYEGCPRRYRFAYVDKRPEDRPVPRTWRFGSAVHEGLEAAYRILMERPSAPHSELAEAAAETVAASWQRLGLGDGDVERRRAVWHTTRALAKDVLKVGDILGVEIPLRGELEGDDRIAGIADLILARPDGVIEIVDHKVTRWRATPDELQDDFQLNLYGYLARLRWPDTTRVVGTHHYPTGPGAVSVTLADDRMEAARARVEAAAAAIGRDRDFLPVPSERCDHCPWQPSCPEGTAYLDEVRRPEGPIAVDAPSRVGASRGAVADDGGRA